MELDSGIGSETGDDFDSREPLTRSLRRPGLVCALVGLAAIAMRLALLPLIPIPVPIFHDEFSYLLGADTFAFGRLTNPPHPMWVHLETFHVNQQPTYCSKYPPAQALFLAFGQRLFGNPWFGVCLGMGLMFACICWMLLGWVSPWPALMTTALAVMGWGFTGRWINSYWGGAVAAAGGAMLIGAIPRLTGRPKSSTVVLGALGLVLLAGSRPFEGALTAIGAGLVLLWRVRREGGSLKPRTLVPFLLVIIPAAMAWGYYNYRTSGSPAVPPYLINERMYGSVPLFYMQAPIPEPVYRHPHIRKFWVEWVKPISERARKDPWTALRRSSDTMWKFYFFTPVGMAMALGLLFGRSWKITASLAIAALPIAGLMLREWALAHYLAPAFGAFLIIAAVGMQALCGWKIRGARVGVFLAIATLGIAFSLSARAIVVEVYLMSHPTSPVATRPQLIERLSQQPGSHLVIVHYGQEHNTHHEWVYNRADIDASKIVWAQDMGAAKNQELVDYYRGRKIWLLEPDIDPLAVVPYAAP